MVSQAVNRFHDDGKSQVVEVIFDQIGNRAARHSKRSDACGCEGQAKGATCHEAASYARQHPAGGGGTKGDRLMARPSDSFGLPEGRKAHGLRSETEIW
jgi:hypothetical protein